MAMRFNMVESHKTRCFFGEIPMKITMVLGFPMVSQALPADLGQLPD